jgi:hypothetical protein
MSEIVKTNTLLGRWVVVSALALEAVALLLEKPMPGLLEALRGSHSVYPIYTNVLWCIPYVVCCWGILTWRQWAFTLVGILSLFEFVSFAVVATIFNNFGRGDIFGLTLFLSLSFLRLSAEKFTQRNQLA